MQILGIPFQTIPRKRTQLGIPFRRTKIESNLSEFRTEQFREDKTTQNKTRQPKISKIMSEKRTFEVRTNHFACFIKLESDPQLKFRTKWSYTGYPLKN
jgi:hypothetical protein